jgi:vacuolar-type H+-ATPase subunit H
MRRDVPSRGRQTITAEAAKRRLPGAAAANPGHRLGPAGRAAFGEPLPRFPLASQGYDPAIVDQRFADLEQEVLELDRELANLQAATPLSGEVAAEIARFGEQVSAILIAAHESAHESTRRAEAEAERRIADAESRARTITDDASREVKRLQNDIASLSGQRERLLADLRSIADGLRALADTSSEDSPTAP